MSTISETAEENINKTINDITKTTIEAVKNGEDLPQVLVLFDDKGNGNMLPWEVQSEIFNPEKKRLFLPMMKSFIEFIKEKDGLNIVKSVIFQSVYYAKKDSSFDRNSYEQGSISEDPDSEEAVMIVVESKGKVEYKIHHAIYNDEGTSAAVSDKPTEEYEFSGEDIDKVESWMIGLLQ